jgi:hypothetical protein
MAMARVVITMEGGLIQHIMTDLEGIEVMVLDFIPEAETTSASRNSRETRCMSSKG